MAVKFKQAYSRYGPGDIAVFAPVLEQKLVEQGFAELYTEAPMEDKDKAPDPKETRQPDKPQTRQTTVGPQKR